jgi:hypothetical protein
MIARIRLWMLKRRVRRKLRQLSDVELAQAITAMMPDNEADIAAWMERPEVRAFHEEIRRRGLGARQKSYSPQVPGCRWGPPTHVRPNPTSSRPGHRRAPRPGSVPHGAGCWSVLGLSVSPPVPPACTP